MMNWTNGRYVSNLHRVVNRKAKARMSLPHFANPDYDAIIAPIPALIEPGTTRSPGRSISGNTWTTSTRDRWTF
jgi:isopenicillin N synthase-like dioxygenase